jgi:hypothetical protein
MALSLARTPSCATVTASSALVRSLSLPVLALTDTLCVCVRRNVVHRHEPPVTSTPVRILHRDDARDFIVIDKPGSIVRPFCVLCALGVWLTGMAAGARDGSLLLPVAG